MAFGLAATVASGVLYGLALPTARLHLLAWVALVPLLLALRGAGPRRALFFAWVWTIVAAYTVGDWFPRSIASYYEQPASVGIAFFFAVSTFMAAPFYMAFAVWYGRLAVAPGFARPLVVAAGWTAAELGRTELLGGNPWALFGYSQMDVSRLIQIADLASVYGITFVLVAVNAALADVLSAGRARRAAALRAVAAAGVVAAAAFAYGEMRLTSAVAPSDRPIAVALVQGNLDLGTQWRDEFYGRNLDVYLRLTREVLQASRPEIVFWPENALTFFLESEPYYRAAISQVMAPSGAELVVGGPRATIASPPAYYNSVFLLSPEGAIRASYDKQRLLPFAEYFPFQTIGFVRRRFAKVREFTPGAPQPPLPTAVGLAGVTICNEAMFPRIAAARAREGAVFFVDPAHDTWLTPKFSAQQFDIVRLRTVEQRRWLVRASTSGPSAIVDPFGQVRVRTDFFTTATVTGTIEPRTERTPYGRLGDLFAYACVAATVVTGVRSLAGGR